MQTLELDGLCRRAEHRVRYVGGYSTGGSALDRASARRRGHLLTNADGIFCGLASGGGEHVDEARLAQIDVPVTIAEAKLSPPFLRRFFRHLRRLMPQARVVTRENIGHHVGLDSPQDLLEILREAAASPTAGHSQP